MECLNRLIIVFLLFQASYANLYDFDQLFGFDVDNDDISARDLHSNWDRKQLYNDRRAVVEDELEQLLDSVYNDKDKELKGLDGKHIASTAPVTSSGHLSASSSSITENTNDHVSSPLPLPSSEHNLAMVERSLDNHVSLHPSSMYFAEHSLDVHEHDYDASLSQASGLYGVSMVARNVDGSNISPVPSSLHLTELRPTSLSSKLSLFRASSLHDLSMDSHDVSLLPSSDIPLGKRTLNTELPVVTSMPSRTGSHSLSAVNTVIHTSKVMPSSHSEPAHSIQPSGTVSGVTASHHHSHVSLQGVGSSAFIGHSSRRTTELPTPALSSYRTSVPIMTSRVFEHWSSETHNVWGSFPPTRSSSVYGSSVPTHLPHQGSASTLGTAYSEKPPPAGWPSHYSSSSDIFPTATNGGMSSAMPDNSEKLPNLNICPVFPGLMMKYLSGFPTIDQLNAHPNITVDSFNDDIKKSLDILALTNDSEMAAKELLLMMAERMIGKIAQCPTSMVNRIVVYAISRTFQNITQDARLHNLTTALSRFVPSPLRMARSLVMALYKSMTASLVKKVHLDLFKAVERFEKEVYLDLVFDFDQSVVQEQSIKRIVERHLHMGMLPPVLQCKGANDLKSLYLQETDGLFRRFDVKILAFLTHTRHSGLNIPPQQAVKLSSAFRPLVRRISKMMTTILQSAVNGRVDGINRYGHVLDESQLDDFKILLTHLGWITTSDISHDATNLAEVEYKDIKLLKSIVDDVKADDLGNKMPLIYSKLTSLLSGKCERAKHSGSMPHPVCTILATNH